MPQAGSNNKQNSKAAQKDKAETHAADLAMGLTATMKKEIAKDTLLCIKCLATQLGPTTVCECPGGRTKPPADYDTKVPLLNAANARAEIAKKVKMRAAAAQQTVVQGEKAKKAAAKELDGLADLDLSSPDMVDAQFEPGQKLGFAIERNAVFKVTEGSAAEEQKIHVGWVIRKINGEEAPANKVALMKVAAAAMKQGPVKFTFQTPMEDGTHFCKDCDKFVPQEEYDAAQLEAGPGKQVCMSCQEYADMFG